MLGNNQSFERDYSDGLLSNPNWHGRLYDPVHRYLSNVCRIEVGLDPSRGVPRVTSALPLPVTKPEEFLFVKRSRCDEIDVSRFPELGVMVYGNGSNENDLSEFFGYPSRFLF